MQRICLAFILSCLILSAQPIDGVGTFRPDRGFLPSGSYSVNDVETVSDTTGAVSFRIPLAKLPPGRAGKSWGVDLQYNSNLYDVRTKNADSSTVISPPAYSGVVQVLENSPSGGWQYSYMYSLQVDEILTRCQTGNLNSYYPVRINLVTPDGGAHLLRLSGQTDFDGSGYYAYDAAGNRVCESGLSLPATIPSPLVYFTTDGTYIRVLIHNDPNVNYLSWVATFPDGSSARGRLAKSAPLSGFSDYICDPNDNCVTVTNVLPASGNFPRTELEDAVGRKITITFRDANCSSLPRCASSQDEVAVWAFGSSTATGNPAGTEANIWQVNWTQVPVGAESISDPNQFTYPCALSSGGNGEICRFSGGHRSVSSILTPVGNNLSYDFTYHGRQGSNLGGWGEVKSIEFPGMAGDRTRIDYTWRYPGGSRAILPLAQNPVATRTLTYQDRQELPEGAVALSGASRVWTYTFALDKSTIVGPAGDTTITHYGSDGWNYGGLVSKIELPSGEQIHRFWQTNLPPGSGIETKNPYLRSEYRVLAGQTSPFSAVRFTYDKNGNVTEKVEYGGQTAAPALQPAGSILRTNKSKVAYPTAEASLAPPPFINASLQSLSPGSESAAHLYWQHNDLWKRNAVVESTTLDGSGIVRAAATFTYFDAKRRGNVTQEARWDSTRAAVYSPPLSRSTNATVIDRTFDNYGNVLSETDPVGNITATEWELVTPLTGSCPPNFVNLYPSKVTTAFGTGVAQSRAMKYDCATGLVTRSTDLENSIDNTVGYDRFGRVTSLNEGGLRQTLTNYNDLGRSVTVRSSLASFDATAGLQTNYDFNSLGQLWRVTRTDDGAPGLLTETSWETYVPGGGRRVVRSNPYRGPRSPITELNQPTMGWTVEAYDSAGRLSTVRTFKGADFPPLSTTNSNLTGTTQTAYNGATTTVTDPDGKTRSTTIDALGRIASADDGIASAAYSYDVLDNLTSVLQVDGAVQQTRTFVYDSLARLTSATNPETGEIKYGYFPNGLLKTRDDDRGSSMNVTMAYDAQNRLISKTYGSAITPNVTYCYDRKTNGSNGFCYQSMDVPNGWGRLTAVINSNANVQYREFDALGRVTKSAQVAPGLGGPTYAFAYEYNPGGLLTSETYPSGRKIQYTPTSANRVRQVNSVLNQAQTDYARQMTYAPNGAPASWSQGPVANPFTQEWKYNSRMQTTQLHASGGSGTLLKLTLGYGDANNNGNLRDQTMETGVKTYRQNYSYDAANRLTNFEENILPSLTVTTRDTFQYDRFGNQWRTSSLGLPPSAVGPASSSAYNAAKNQLVNGSYDAAGNQQLIGANTAIYDAENKIIMNYIPTPGTWVEVKYDGEGKRVLRTVDGVQTRYVYDAFGELAAEYTTGSVSGGTKYLVTDHLGSTRLVLDATGNCVQRSDYLPFGFEQWRTTADHPCYGGNPPVPQSTTLRFTSKERDAETGLDYFGARYLSGTLGRFTSPDAPFADQNALDPQSWNLYVYVRNNPLNSVDLDGRTCVTTQYKNKEGDLVDSVADNGDGQGCPAAGVKPSANASRPSDAADIVGHGTTTDSQYDNTWAENASNFIAGAGDSLSFGLTALFRRLLPAGEQADICSSWYSYGEASETVAEVGLMGLSAGLKAAIGKSTGKAIRKEAVRQGATGHHINPLIGHPVNLTSGKPTSTLFPTGGLPPSIHSGEWNLRRDLRGSAHAAAHVRLIRAEAVASRIVNPKATGVRVVANFACSPF